MGTYARGLRCTHCNAQFGLDPLWEGCPACRREAPLLAIAAAAQGSTVQFLGVDILDDRSDSCVFIEQYDIPYPSCQRRSKTGQLAPVET